MFITQEEAERRLNSSKNLANSLATPVDSTNQKPRKEKPAKEPPTPENLKTLGASLVRQGVDPKDVAKELNISAADIASANRLSVQASIDRIRELALNKMLIALGLMTADKFENASLKDLTAATANLSRVIEKTSPQEINDQRVQFIVMAPATREINHYKVVDV